MSYRFLLQKFLRLQLFSPVFFLHLATITNVNVPFFYIFPLPYLNEAFEKDKNLIILFLKWLKVIRFCVGYKNIKKRKKKESTPHKREKLF